MITNVQANSFCHHSIDTDPLAPRARTTYDWMADRPPPYVTIVVSLLATQLSTISVHTSSLLGAFHSGSTVIWFFDIEQQNHLKGLEIAEHHYDSDHKSHSSRSIQRNLAISLLTFIRSVQICIILIIGSVTLGILSLILAIWWSISHDDLSGGFTLGGYIVSVSAVLIGAIGIFHRRKCHCWSEEY
jgi:hypothetical protein